MSSRDSPYLRLRRETASLFLEAQTVFSGSLPEKASRFSRFLEEPLPSSEELGPRTKGSAFASLEGLFSLFPQTCLL